MGVAREHPGAQSGRPVHDMQESAYYFGHGVARDYITAHKLLNLAATAGDESARTLLAEVAARIAHEQLAEAQASGARHLGAAPCVPGTEFSAR